MKLLKGKKAIITGGSDGIGYAIAKSFAENGADILLVGRNKNKLDKALQELSKYGVSIKIISHDLSKCEKLQELTSMIIDSFHDIDILVNNAGEAEFVPFNHVDIKGFDHLFDLNVKSPFFLTQGLLPALKKNKASIINISSFHAQRTLPGYPSSVYSMTKSAINAFTKTLAYELGPHGIRVNAIAPGNVATSKVKTALEGASEQAKMKIQELISTIYPLGRMGNAYELSGIAVYLASDQSSWTTGSIFNIDGGLTTN
ncbi:SDR family NAD(P)-dependent oxidoreductase [Clostridium neuense]|uniref:SDR family NAD(P)-dependent oxidoreductase n=1 Tax=Clostridium neuense TaxID=1728934 RepID=A0ABW8TBT8_9CLOT